MLASKVACPQCQAQLKTNQPLPIGKRVKCPKCGAHFSVGADMVAPVEIAAGPPPGPGNGMPSLTPFVGLEGPRHSSSPAYTPRAATEITAAPKSNFWLLIAIVAGCSIFLGGGITLAVICFSGAKPDSEQEKLAKDEDDTDDYADERAASAKKNTATDKTARGPQRPGEEAPLPQPYLSSVDQKRVNEAIDRGARYLLSIQKPNGSWEDPEKQIKNFTAGLTAFAALTLLECGIPPSDPAIQKAATFIRAQEGPERRRPLYLTYEVSLAVLFLDRLGDSVDNGLIERLALRLVANQQASGGWNYYCKYAPSPEEQQLLLSMLRKNQSSIAKLADPLDLAPVQPTKLADGVELPKAFTGLAVWRNSIDSAANPQRKTDESDNSNTQFAILALWAAKKQGLPLQRTLTLMVKRFQKGQEEDGRWGYLLNGPEMAEGAEYPTMTCAGLLGLAVGMGLTNEARGSKGQPRNAAGLDPKIKKGLNVVAGRIGEPGKPWDPKAKLIDLYFLWSVERVSVIYNLRRLGGMDWYGWGAEKIVASQAPDGSWKNGGYSHSVPTADTCFALLFLKRANLAKDLTSKLQLGD